MSPNAPYRPGERVLVTASIDGEQRDPFEAAFLRFESDGQTARVWVRRGDVEMGLPAHQTVLAKPDQRPEPLIVVLELGYTPQSVNEVMYADRWVRRRDKQSLQRDLELMLMSKRLPRPLPGPVFARAELRFPTRRRRDEGNYRAPLEKALGDALTNGGWLPDDTQDWFRFGRALIAPETGPNRTLIEIRIHPDQGGTR